MQCLILSAGLGTRLKPLTDNLPKVMIPLLDKPLLQWQIEWFKKFGISEFLINLHHLPEKIKDYFGDGSKFGVTISYNFEQEILGTGGAIWGFKDKLQDNFLLIYGDVFNRVDYSKFLKYSQEKGGIGTMVVRKTDHPHDSDLVELDEGNKFIKIHTKPHVSSFKFHDLWAMTGIYFFSKQILDFIPENKYSELDHDVLPKVVESNENFYGYTSEEYIKDIGTIERYKEIVNYLESTK